MQETKKPLTPCEQRGLKAGQWVWCAGDDNRRYSHLGKSWVMLSRDDGTTVPWFEDHTRQKGLACLGVTDGEIDFTQGIHDTKPDWTPGDKPQPPMPDDQIAQAAEAPVEWDGSNLPPVGSVCEFVQGRGIVRSIDEAWEHGDHVEILAHKLVDVPVAVVWNVRLREANQLIAECLAPIQSERDKAVAEIERIVRDTIERGGPISSCVAAAIYDAGYRKQETSNES